MNLTYVSSADFSKGDLPPMTGNITEIDAI